MYKDSHVVVVPAYGKVSKLHQIHKASHEEDSNDKPEAHWKSYLCLNNVNKSQHRLIEG